MSRKELKLKDTDIVENGAAIEGECCNRAEGGIRDKKVNGVQKYALKIIMNCRVELMICRFELMICRFELMICRFDLMI